MAYPQRLGTGGQATEDFLRPLSFLGEARSGLKMKNIFRACMQNFLLPQNFFLSRYRFEGCPGKDDFSFKEIISGCYHE